MKLKAILIFLIFFSLGSQNVNAGADSFNWDSELDLEPLKSLSHDSANNNIRNDHGAGGKPDDQEVNFDDGNPIIISYLKIERDTAGSIVCERVCIDFVINVDNMKSIRTEIVPFSSASDPTDLLGTFYFIKKRTNYHSDSDKDDRNWISEESYHEGEKNEGIFLGPNRVYKFSVFYTVEESGSDVNYIRVFWLVEDIGKTIPERWDIIYGDGDTFHTSFIDKGFDPSLENGYDYSVIDDPSTPPPDITGGEEAAKLFGNQVFNMFVNGLIAMLILKFGFSFLTSSKNFGGTFGSLVFIFIGIMFAVTAVGNAMSIITGAALTDVLEIATGIDSDYFEIMIDPIGWGIEELTGVDINPLNDLI